MKKKIISLILISIVSVSWGNFFENANYVRTLDNCALYEATLLIHENKLYTDPKGAVEQYQIMTDGSLELLKRIDKFHYDVADAIIQDNTLYVTTREQNSSYSKIFVIDIASNEMELINEISTYAYSILTLAANDEHLFYAKSGVNYSYILDRTNYQQIGQMETGYQFEIRDSLIYMCIIIDNCTYLQISNISNINVPQILSTTYLADDLQNMKYSFDEDILFIGMTTQVAILDVSNPENPVILSIIDNVPGTPSVNIFTTLVQYNNYLIFGNKETKFWIYDVTDLTNPQYLTTNYDFIGGTTIKRSMTINGDDIYYSRWETAIFQIDAGQLPGINIIDHFGNNGRFHFYNFAYPYILYSNPYQLKQYYININDPEPEPICLAESPGGWVSPVCFNDSLICFLTAENNDENLQICNYDNENISVVATISLGSTNFDDVFFREEHLILAGDMPGVISINTVNSDYSLYEVGNFEVGEDSYLIFQTTQCDDDNLFIKSEYNNEDMIDIFENQIPFNFVSSFNITVNNHDFDSMYFLENNRVIFVEGYSPGALYYLCEFIFPDIFVLIDSYMTSDAYFTFHDDFLFWCKNLDGLSKFFIWQNDDIELVQTHDFDVEINDVYFVPEQSKFYAIGRYNVQEYSCDFVSVNDNQIPILDANLSNHPNPFNPSTEIRFQLSGVSDQQTVDLTIYNIKGQKVKTFSNHQITQSSNQQIVWDGTDDNNQRVSSGVYFYQLEVNEKPVASKKCLLLK